MKPTATMPLQPWRGAAETLTIRMAVPADTAALGRLAQLDSAPGTEPVPMLVAEVGGELRAALPLDGGRAIADPFRPTAELVVILAERAPARAAAGTPDCSALATDPRPACGAGSARTGIASADQPGRLRSPEPVSLAIHLLGGPHLERDGEPVAGSRGHKAWGLLAYLLLLVRLLCRPRRQRARSSP